MDSDSSFGDVLRRLRRAALLSQEELAQRAGLTARALSNLERGRAMPRASSVRLLAEALSLTVADRRELEAAAHTSPLPDLSSPAPPVPTQLPSDPPSFVSRDDELAVLDALMSGNGATTIGLISGMSGVGKTTLAVHWAHRRARRVGR